MSERRRLARVRRVRLRQAFAAIKEVFAEIGPENMKHTDSPHSRATMQAQAEEIIRKRYRLSPIFIMLLIKLIPIFIDLFFSGRFSDKYFAEIQSEIVELLFDAEDAETVTSRSSINYLEGRFEVGPSDFLRVIAAILTVLAEFYDWWNQ